MEQQELDHFSILDASISDLLSALALGQVTSVELVARHLRRVCVYDANGLQLSSIPILNARVFDEASASDARRAAGVRARPLEGIPFLVKDNIKVKGMSVAAGSKAFEYLIATEDAACVQVLRAAGAIVMGRTNMPGMANGGMQRGLYGRAESPYNLKYLTAAYASGSSNGSATATAANFGVFGLGTETVSSGRSPASNNSLVAYTPSRGLLPLRGVWPLYPTCDVLVPHARTMADLFHILNVLGVSDPNPSGDFWSSQPCVPLPTADAVRPQDFQTLKNGDALKGKRLGVPRMYIGGQSPVHIRIRTSILTLWEQARKRLEACGATVIEVDFPLVTTYEEPGPSDQIWANIAGLPENWLSMERCELIAHAWDDFLATNGQPGLESLTAVDPDSIFPLEPETLQGETEEDNQLDWRKAVNYPHSKLKSMFELPGMEKGLGALEHARKSTLEDWMDSLDLDAVVFPANGDVGPANADFDDEGSRIAWENGVLYSNGNLPIRHLGVPTISVPMGVMEDTKMPVNITFAGKAYDDNQLLRFGYAFEAATQCRVQPPLVPALDSDFVDRKRAIKIPREVVPAPVEPPKIRVTKKSKTVDGSTVHLDVQGVFKSAHTKEVEELTCYINGEPHSLSVEGDTWRIKLSYPVSGRENIWSRWTSPALVQTIIIIVCRCGHGLTAGELVLL